MTYEYDEAMTSRELAVSPRTIAVEEQNAEQRRAALERLSAEAETADANRAREIMLKGRMISDLLRQAKEPFEESRLAGKASVLAARRLGIILNDLSARPIPESRPGHRGGFSSSPRGALANELGLSAMQRCQILRLGAMPDPEFQRYIQRTDVIPSLNGALVVARKRPGSPSASDNYFKRRRMKAGVKTPNNPSLDEAYTLIVRSLGHLSGSWGKGNGNSAVRLRAISRAMDHLYAAEDLLKPYRAGYGK